MSLLVFIFTLLVLGLIVWGVNEAPKVDADFKAFAKWALIVVGAIITVVFVANLLGISTGVSTLRLY